MGPRDTTANFVMSMSNGWLVVASRGRGGVGRGKRAGDVALRIETDNHIRKLDLEFTFLC